MDPNSNPNNPNNPNGVGGTQQPPAPQNWDKPKITSEGHVTGYKDLFKRNWHPTIVYCGVFWSFGMCVGFLGPTLLDLGCQTSTTMDTFSWVFLAQLLFTLIGSLIAGYLSQKVDANYVIAMATLLIPASMFVIPLCKALVSLAITLAVMGINMGLIDTLANLQMIQLYKEDVPPFLQAMHFCYGFGAFVSPMIAQPFLLDEDCSPMIEEERHNVSLREILDPAAGGALGPGANSSEALYPAKTLDEAQSMTEVRYAFWIMCALQIPVAMMVISLIMRQKCTVPVPDTDAAPDPKMADQTHYGSVGKQQSDKKFFWKEDAQYTHHREDKFCGSGTVQIISITLLTAMMMFIYEGLQSAYAGYVFSYAVKSIVDLSRTEGAYLNACFWGTFSLGRLLSIVIATRLSPAFMLLCNILGSLISMILILSMRHDHVALYVGTCLFGMFLSSVAPTALSLCEQYINVTSSITTFIIVMAAMGESVCPVIVGNMFVPLGPVSFVVFCLVMVIISIVLYILIWGIGQQTPKVKAQGNSSFFFSKMCCMRTARGGGGGADGEGDDGEPVRHVKYYSRMSESDSNIELNNIPAAAQ